MNPAFVNIVLNNNYDDYDENPQPNPNKMDIVDSIYDEIEKDKQMIVEQVVIVEEVKQVHIVDEKLFSKSCGCFFF
jgi:hypothetical protein